MFPEEDVAVAGDWTLKYVDVIGEACVVVGVLYGLMECHASPLVVRFWFLLVRGIFPGRRLLLRVDERRACTFIS